MTLDEDLVRSVDRVVKQAHTTRSAFTREAFRAAPHTPWPVAVFLCPIIDIISSIGGTVTNICCTVNYYTI